MADKEGSTNSGSETTSIAEMMRSMLEDRNRREDEIAEERRRHEEEFAVERRHRDEEQAEERQRNEARAIEERQSMQQQVVALQQLVAEIGTGRATARDEFGPGKPKLAKLMTSDDIEAYLTTFERMMAIFRIERARWSYMLAPQLTGKAQKAFAALEDERTGDYDALKTAILHRYDISTETYRTSECASAREVQEIIAMEQLLDSMSDEIRSRVRERKPKTCAEAGELADDIERARRSSKAEVSRKGEKRQFSPPLKCFSCGQLGHRTPDCPRGRRQEERPRRAEGPATIPGRGPQPAQRSDRYREPKCYECGKTGHFSSRCPSRALCAMSGDEDVEQRRISEDGAVCRDGLVDGVPVADILLDTGCTQTLVHRRLIAPGKETHGSVAVRCAHGDKVSYPTAQVNITIRDEIFSVLAGVSETLPVSVLLGRDVPQLVCLKKVESNQCGLEPKPKEALVVTQAQARKEAETATLQEQMEIADRVRPNPLDVDLGREVSMEPEVLGAEFDPDLFQPGPDREKLSRRQKRVHRREVAAERQEKETQHPLDGLVAEELRTLQQSDPTLAAVREAADAETGSAESGFFKKDGVIYKLWTPPETRLRCGCN